ncbi:hypothetical protein MHBO_002488 [Bonamia ostreae]|uniref:GED domain-containing protein n=1 Tax=Bonamia ostreae TaxID=126728 RepID=A0ABV2AMJ7_9EUKA
MAYFKISFMRFADNIPLVIDRLLLRNFANSVLEYLVQRLGLFERDEEDIRRFLEDSMETKRSRSNLKYKLATLTKALDEINTFYKQNELFKREKRDFGNKNLLKLNDLKKSELKTDETNDLKQFFKTFV